MIVYKKICVALVFCINIYSLRAQSDVELLNRAIQQDSVVIAAIAVYPAPVREKIFTAAGYPDVLIQTEKLQKTTGNEFRDLLSSYNKEVQAAMWDIVRYPGLRDSLIANRNKTREEINLMLKHFPAEIHETARTYGITHADVLKKIRELDAKVSARYDALLKPYAGNIEYAFRSVTAYPELIALLNNNLSATVFLGDFYKRNPMLLNAKMDSLSLEIARQNSKALEDWKKGLNENPEAQKEFEEAVNEYVGKEEYEASKEVSDPEVVVNYVYYPYPYWYGYPWWYDYPYWYPYPYWYHCGYYFGPYGIVYIGLPSWHFTRWYFHHHHHHHHYPHFSDHSIHHYYGHRESLSSGFNREVGNWIVEQEKELPGNYFAKKEGRVERLKEFGKFEMDYNEFKEKNPGTTISKKAYSERNPENYPQRNQINKGIKVKDPVYKNPENPGINKPKTQPKTQPKPKPKTQPKTQPKPSRPNPKVIPKSNPRKK